MRGYTVTTEANAQTFATMLDALAAIAELRRFEARTPFARPRRVTLKAHTVAGPIY